MTHSGTWRCPAIVLARSSPWILKPSTSPSLALDLHPVTLLPLWSTAAPLFSRTAAPNLDRHPQPLQGSTASVLDCSGPRSLWSTTAPVLGSSGPRPLRSSTTLVLSPFGPALGFAPLALVFLGSAPSHRNTSARGPLDLNPSDRPPRLDPLGSVPSHRPPRLDIRGSASKARTPPALGVSSPRLDSPALTRDHFGRSGAHPAALLGRSLL